MEKTIIARVKRTRQTTFPKSKTVEIEWKFFSCQEDHDDWREKEEDKAERLWLPDRLYFVEFKKYSFDDLVEMGVEELKDMTAIQFAQVMHYVSKNVCDW